MSLVEHSGNVWVNPSSGRATRGPRPRNLGPRGGAGRASNRYLQSPGGRWLTAALDPFHDAKVDVRGYPDMHTGMTTVQKVRIQFKVTRPAGVAAGNWDCHVVALPLAHKTAFVQGKSANPPSVVTFADPLTAFDLGPIQAFCSAAGADTLPTTANAITQALNDMVLPSDDLADYHVGPARVIAAGFEVRDATAVLNKQGAVAVTHTTNYATPTVLSINQTTGTTITTGGRVYTGPGKSFALPPASLGLCSKNPDFITWNAQEGVYVPLNLETVDNPMTVRQSDPVWFHETSMNGQDCTGFVTNPYPIGQNLGGDYTYAGNLTVPCTGRYCKTIPFSTASAYFTGLHQDAVLNVTYVAWIERAPTVWQTDLITFMNPSPAYDPAAFVQYMAVKRRARAGTKVGDNDAGDWWDDMLGLLAKGASVVSPYLGLIPEVGPAASAAAAAVAAAAKATQSAGRAIDHAVVKHRADVAAANAAKARAKQQKNKGKK